MSLSMDERGVILACSSCGKRNRVPFGRGAKCGHCGAPMPSPGEPIDVPSAPAFDALIRDSRVPVVVDFWAPWCGPCRAVAPEIVRVAADHTGHWILAKVDTEALPDLAARFQIQSIPTMALFKGAREVARTTGARPAAEIERFVTGALAREMGT